MMGDMEPDVTRSEIQEEENESDEDLISSDDNLEEKLKKKSIDVNRDAKL